ncbi:tRNA (adenosine(37)-N6)-dimethylallyltransferase MiaA [Sphingomonas sinipercae]|uniref:tRNA dimethylallyltransferase n=1 Tax=Sphingomonas sinipercae TaxID=2714944 RepID=A0A6G7ZNM9_9SPHN|nr:tRNA (adenosine(37)-N6)-dimethylallyltransferase MiaA [Sphingomonas sinipercae]QIL02581.1 tRNA (adenosine(37)-N6)-dimethylallyltransferase MiaA [Sphingomonas sinipercae]
MPIRPPLALIAGPTASGKSALALRLAEAVDGVIVNADSAQIYRDLPILSAAPTADDQARAEHRLYGFRDGANPCSAADWAALARREIEKIHAEERLPILVGGTGLYIRTLLDGIAPVPPIDPSVREYVRGREVEANWAELAKADPDAAKCLGPRDTTRVSRALEVVLSSGRPLAHWQQLREGGIVASVTLHPIVLMPPRAWLYERCDRRFVAMWNGGALPEVERLLARQLDPALPVMRAIGVREATSFLRGEVTSEKALSQGQQATRNYAKRQYTWLAHQPPAQWRRFAEPLTDETSDDALALLHPKA